MSHGRHRATTAKQDSMKNAPYFPLIVAALCIGFGYAIRIANEPRCDADAIRTEYDAYRATTIEHLRHAAVRDSLKAIEIDSLKALMDAPVPPVRVVLEGHRKAAQDAGLDTLRAGLLNPIE